MPSENIVRIFYGYADEDDTALKNKLDRYLLHTNKPNTEYWDHREITAGANRATEINKYLNKADIILLLISHNFMYSMSRDKEIQEITETALARHHQGDARVIPIIFCPVDIEHAPFSMLKVLPEDGEPIDSSPDKNKACLNVWNGVKKAIAEIHKRHEVQQKKVRADEYFSQGNYEKSLQGYNEILLILKNISWNKDTIDILQCKAATLHQLNRLDEALLVYEEAMRIEPDNSQLYEEKGDILFGLKRFFEAFDAYKQAVQKSPNAPIIHKKQGDTLYQMGRWKDAIAAYDKAIDIIEYNKAFKMEALIEDSLTVAHIYTKKGEAHWEISEFEDALLAFDAAIEIDPDNGELWRYRGEICTELGDIDGAKKSYGMAISLEPSNPYFHKEYGDALFNFEHLSESIDEYGKAIALKPDFGFAYRGRSRVFQAIAQEKLEEYRQLMKLAQEDDDQFKQLRDKPDR